MHIYFLFRYSDTIDARDSMPPHARSQTSKFFQSFSQIIMVKCPGSKIVATNSYPLGVNSLESIGVHVVHKLNEWGFTLPILAAAPFQVLVAPSFFQAEFPA